MGYIKDEQIASLPIANALQALCAVARRRGLDPSVEQLRRSYVFPDGAPPTSLLIAIARDLGLEAESIRMRWRDLPRLSASLPAMLRLDDGAILLLEAARHDPAAGDVVVLQDPANGAGAMIAVDERKLAPVWSGEVILVKRRFAITDEQRPFGMGWLFGQVLRERRLFGDIAAAALVNTIFTIAPPFLVMIILDRVLTNRSMSTLAVMGAAVGVVIAFETALACLRRMFTEIATTRIDARLNLHILERILKLPLDYFERNPTGAIMSKLSRIWQIRHFLTGQLFGAILDGVPLLGLIPAMLLLDWRLSLFVFALTGAVFVVVAAFVKPLGRRFGKVVIAEQRKGAHLVETLHGMRTIKSLALEGRRRHEWDGLVAAAIGARHDLGRLGNVPQTLCLPLERMIYSGSFIIGAYIALTSPDAIEPGVLVAFAMLAMRLAQPLVQFARLQQDTAEVRGAIAEVASILNAPSEQGRSGSGLRAPIRGEIAFEDVSFRYAPGAPLALDRVRLRIERGQMFGIMGRSGSGKTTVTRLLQGLSPDYEGVIKIDGVDLREIDLDHLRAGIGVVPQENFLFSGSIRDNIAVARPGAPFSEIVRAAQLAGADEFIERMPRGYDTRLEEGAVNLSGGQRQRLAIARALLIDPAVLVLDEATSALDAESEAIINGNLQRIAQGRTIVCISHRLSMLAAADQILVLERGRVYDIGRHDDLMFRCDIYKHLWRQQNRHSERSLAHVQRALDRAAS